MTSELTLPANGDQEDRRTVTDSSDPFQALSPLPEVNQIIHEYYLSEPLPSLRLENSLAELKSTLVLHPRLASYEQLREIDPPLFAILQDVLTTPSHTTYKFLSTFQTAATMLRAIYEYQPFALLEHERPLTTLLSDYITSNLPLLTCHPNHFTTFCPSLRTIQSTLSVLTSSHYSPLIPPHIRRTHWDEIYNPTLHLLGWRRMWYSIPTGFRSMPSSFCLLGIPWECGLRDEKEEKRMEGEWGYMGVMGRVLVGELELGLEWEEGQEHGMGWMT